MAAPSYLYGFGTGSHGTMPFGTSAAPIVAIERVTVEAENRLRLHFNTAPSFLNLQTCRDGFNADAYTITAGTCLDRLGEATRPVDVVATALIDPLTVDLILDRPMSSYPGCYTLVVDGLKDAVSEIPFAPQTFEVMGLFKGIPAYTKERTINNRDIANPQTFEALFDPLPVEGEQANNAILGAFPTDQRGDVAYDEGLVSYKKRVYRRLTTRKGKFAHLPDYGTFLVARIKELGTPGIRDAMAVDAEEQIRQEPETLEVSVRIRDDDRNPGLHYFVIRVRTSIGTSTFTVPVNSNRN